MMGGRGSAVGAAGKRRYTSARQQREFDESLAKHLKKKQEAHNVTIAHVDGLSA